MQPEDEKKPAADEGPVDQGVGPHALPEPDFLLDNGRLRCYYAGTVAKMLAAERMWCATVCEDIAGDNKWSDAATAAEAIRLGPNVEANRPKTAQEKA